MSVGDTADTTEFAVVSIRRWWNQMGSLRTVIELISATTTETRLTIQASHDPNWYPTGIHVTDAELGAVPLSAYDWHGDWNNTINAQSDVV